MSAVNLHQGRHCQIRTCPNEAVQRCARCANTWYCSVGCQQADWLKHRKICGAVVLYREEEKVREVVRRVLPSVVAGVEISQKHRESYERKLEFYRLEEGRDLLPHLKRLPESEERDEMALLFDVYGCLEANKYYSRIKGIEFVKNIDRQCGPFNSSDHAFYHASWYQLASHLNHVALLKKLYGLNGETVKFLKAQGYKVAEVPEVGDIVVYSVHVHGDKPVKHEIPKTTNFGVVLKIGKDGTIEQLQSKFSHGPIFNHRLEQVLYCLGDTYTVLRAKPSG